MSENQIGRFGGTPPENPVYERVLVGWTTSNAKPVREEPSYMMFARANVRDGLPSTPAVVKELLDRIDRQDKQLLAAQAELNNVKQRFH